MRIGIDLDSTLYNFDLTVIRIINKKFKKKYKIEDWIDWCPPFLTTEELEYFHSLYRDNNFMYSLRLYHPIYKDIIEKWGEKHKICIITCRMVNIGKVQLKRDRVVYHEFYNTINEGKENVINSFNLDILIDDCSKYIEAFNKIGIIIDKPYNRETEGKNIFRIQSLPRADKIINGQGNKIKCYLCNGDMLSIYDNDFCSKYCQMKYKKNNNIFTTNDLTKRFTLNRQEIYKMGLEPIKIGNTNYYLGDVICEE